VPELGSVEMLTPDPPTATQSDVDGHDTSDQPGNELLVVVHGPAAGSGETNRADRPVETPRHGEEDGHEICWKWAAQGGRRSRRSRRRWGLSC
jgi:hypothetical protein